MWLEAMMMKHQGSNNCTRKPRWLKQSLPKGGRHEQVRRLLKKGGLHTVCQEAKCPNLWECFSRRTATFLIMGARCTRNCRFCAVGQGPSGLPDPSEPARVSEAVHRLGLRYAVITSVTRDDLEDGGAAHFATTIEAIRKRVPDAMVEVLVPDFQGSKTALHKVLAARPHVLNHNLETVPRLYALVRPEAVYERSLELLMRAKQYDPLLATKSGLMLGLGESPEEVEETLHDLLDAGCLILTLGQYLQPTRQHLNVDRFVDPREFDRWKEKALRMGFHQVASGPLVRSSYEAKELYQAFQKQAIGDDHVRPSPL